MIKSILRVSGRKSPTLDLVHLVLHEEETRSCLQPCRSLPNIPKLNQGGVASVWKATPSYPGAPPRYPAGELSIEAHDNEGEKFN